MQVNISGHHVDVTDALKDYTTEKLAKLEHHAAEIISINAILNVQKARQIAEATIHVKGADLFATAESDDMYAAIDLLSDKLDRQVIKHKQKLQSRKQSVTR